MPGRQVKLTMRATYFRTLYLSEAVIRYRGFPPASEPIYNVQLVEPYPNAEYAWSQPLVCDGVKHTATSTTPYAFAGGRAVVDGTTTWGAQDGYGTWYPRSRAR